MTALNCMIRDLQQNSEKRQNKMKIAMICFSLTGQETGERLLTGFLEKGMEAWLDKKSAYLPDSVSESTKGWAGKQFAQADAIVFIGACGIAVRSIAPYVASKKSDPAVLVIDECGKFVISLLSGHLGGANELALEAAQILQAVPVVTTATDLHHRFAVDVFAKKNRCSIFHMKAAKEVSAALLAGKTVGFYSEFPWEGKLPRGLIRCDKEGFPLQSVKASQKNTDADDEKNFSDEKKNGEVHGACAIGIAVSIHKSCMPFASTVSVVPPCLTLGMGCRRNKEAEGIRMAAQKVLQNLDVYKEAFEQIASINLKKEEIGIHALSDAWKIPFITYTEEELLQTRGDFTPSSFVKTITGVDNVCERSAVLASGQGRLLQKKIGENGVTTAVAAREWRIHFE